jgi:hypothetical protein
LILGLTVIVWFSFSSTVRGLLKDHAVAVSNALTTRWSPRPSHTTSMDSTSVPLHVLVEQLALRVERSFGESHDCDIAYFEHEDDAFALVRWEPTQDVEVRAYVPRGADGRGVAQLERFIELAGLSHDDVVHPPR